MRAVAIIPARGGSKRIPHKNVKLFCGRPMIAWSIAAALESGLFEQIVVSTDDEEIASVAEAYGAQAPFRRPAELANDHTPTLPVITHALRWIQEHSCPTFACCIYATAPLLRPEYLRKGFRLLEDNADADFVVSVTSFASSIFRSLKRDEDGRISMFWPEHEMTRSQDLPAAFHDAAQFYWGRVEAFLTRDSFFSARTYGISLPRQVVQDIDTMEDWAVAEERFTLRLAKSDSRELPSPGGAARFAPYGL